MILNLFRRALGSSNDRYVKTLRPYVARINQLEPEIEKLTDGELRQRTFWLKGRLQAGETLDQILVDAFATVREASRRILGMRHFDVQLMGGIVLHRGIVAEMKTGEGKTLVATLPVYLNALTGRGVHVVTVNDYLAQRDAEWMGQVYEFLGLTVGSIVHGLSDEERRAAYAADVTYATNNELGFDYLRDNMKMRISDLCQRPFHYAIVDEVDSILIDEARTPLIISGPAEESSELYTKVNVLIPHLFEKEFEKDEKSRSVTLTEAGVEHMEKMVKDAGLMKGETLYDIQNTLLVHHINQALKAHKLFSRNVDYIVKDDKVILIDEFTGRMMDGRRYSDGLHQAIEAKEGVKIEIENQTLASITFQNFFRLYPKLAGMTGTAMTEAMELQEIYNLRVVAIPTNHTIQRRDRNDEVYRTFREKQEAVVKLIQECQERKQPILVGTVSIEKSEIFSEILTGHGIPHQVLNARHHDKEALIIAEAGVPGAITIATNMAGRGTDIELGGNLKLRLKEALADEEDEEKRAQIEEELRARVIQDREIVLQAGGLFVIGTERHESRRIDNQLRGRSGRQGDPGASQFFLSLEDDLMRIFGSEKLDEWLKKLGLQEGEAITHPWINRALEKAQQKIEARNFEIRKHLLKYDDVMNDQRKAIYAQRHYLMSQDELQEECAEMRLSVLQGLLASAIPPQTYPDQWNTTMLHEEMVRLFDLSLPFAEWCTEEGISSEVILERVRTAVEEAYTAKENRYGAPTLRTAERNILLRIVDQSWKDHLYSLDHLRQGVHLRSYAQKDPLNEYKREAFALFESMLETIAEKVTEFLFHFEAQPESAQALLSALMEEGNVLGDVFYNRQEEEGNTDLKPIKRIPPQPKMKVAPVMPLQDSQAEVVQASSSLAPGQPDEKDFYNLDIPRNAPCPCHSGKRYKNCHGALAG